MLLTRHQQDGNNVLSQFSTTTVLCETSFEFISCTFASFQFPSNNYLSPRHGAETIELTVIHLLRIFSASLFSARLANRASLPSALENKQKFALEGELQLARLAAIDRDAIFSLGQPRPNSMITEMNFLDNKHRRESYSK